MGFWAGLKRRLRAMIAPSVFLALIGYSGWSATQGERGLNAYVMRQEQLKLAEAELARVVRERDALERRVMGLRTQRLDPDTLDERARAVAGVGDPADIVVTYGVGKRLF